MRQHEVQVRRNRKRSLRALAGFAAIRPEAALGSIAFAIAVLASVLPARTDDAVPIALRLTPGHYQRTEKLVHLITFEMSKTLKSMAAGKADDQTVLEDRAQYLTMKDKGVINETEINTRRYGGDKPKDKSVKERTIVYDGTIAPDGIRTPAREILEDAGDGALDQLPDIPLAPGQTWSFSRQVHTDRDLGQGPMTYVDKVVRVEQRGGHRIAIIEVTGTGRIAPAADLESHGFKPAPMDLAGTAEFDTTSGLPGVQHYTGKVRWGTTVMFAHIGVVFNDTYDAAPLQPGGTAPPPPSSPVPAAGAASPKESTTPTTASAAPR